MLVFLIFLLLYLIIWYIIAFLGSFSFLAENKIFSVTGARFSHFSFTLFDNLVHHNETSSSTKTVLHEILPYPSYNLSPKNLNGVELLSKTYTST